MFTFLFNLYPLFYLFFLYVPVASFFNFFLFLSTYVFFFYLFLLLFLSLYTCFLFFVFYIFHFNFSLFCILFPFFSSSYSLVLSSVIHGLIIILIHHLIICFINISSLSHLLYVLSLLQSHPTPSLLLFIFLFYLSHISLSLLCPNFSFDILSSCILSP